MRPKSWPWGVTVVGKLAIQVIREANGRYRAHLMGKTKRLEGHTDMQVFGAKIGTWSRWYQEVSEKSEQY